MNGNVVEGTQSSLAFTNVNAMSFLVLHIGALHPARGSTTAAERNEIFLSRTRDTSVGRRTERDKKKDAKLQEIEHHGVEQGIVPL